MILHKHKDEYSIYPWREGWKTSFFRDEELKAEKNLTFILHEGLEFKSATPSPAPLTATLTLFASTRCNSRIVAIYSQCNFGVSQMLLAQNSEGTR